VEFGDYQCPHCARAQGIVQGLLLKHSGALRVEFHQFPLVRIHPDARNAALAATCARAQGRFWEYHDALYADPSNLGLARLQSTAGSQGLDGKRFAACIDAPATAQAVADDLRAGAVAGVNGTPAFYVNGRPVPADADELEHVVAEELATGAGAH
jgi:protein-disulfide isomerase